MQQCQIRFQGFHPSVYTKSHLEQICEDILAEAPRGAMLNAVVRKKDNEFSTHVTVNSKSGRFFGLATDPQLFHAVKKVFVQIERKIQKKWQGARHDRASLQDLSPSEPEFQPEPEMA